jgi:cytoskeletal protein RodZ
MFAVQCSFCQHENVPGARFCAECGSPLHLKVCPNPQCGKVSDVDATRCENCGTPFPKIALAQPGAASDAAPSGSDGGSPAAVAGHNASTGSKPGMSAWPLIIVALVAGGLPLLWVNRSLLPAPKTWQPQSEAAKPANPPVPAAAPVAPKRAPAVQAAISPPPPAPAQTAPAETAAPTEPAKPAAVAESPAKEAEARPASREKTKAKRKAKEEKPAAAAAESQQPRPCTEAVAALGLCDPKQAKK